MPELISLDERGFPIVSSSSIDDDKLLQLARREEATCPRLALLIEESVPTRR